MLAPLARHKELRASPIRAVEISLDVSPFITKCADESARSRLVTDGADRLGDALSRAVDAGAVQKACVRIHADECADSSLAATHLLALRQALEGALYKVVSSHVLTVITCAVSTLSLTHQTGLVIIQLKQD